MDFISIKLSKNCFLSILILEISVKEVLTSHLHIAFLVSESYPSKLQFCSHNNKLLFIYSFFLSLSMISVPFSDVEVEQISL